MQGGNLNRTLARHWNFKVKYFTFQQQQHILEKTEKPPEPIGTGSGQPLLWEEKFLLAKEKGLRVIQILGIFSISF